MQTDNYGHDKTEIKSCQAKIVEIILNFKKQLMLHLILNQLGLLIFPIKDLHLCFTIILF